MMKVVVAALIEKEGKFLSLNAQPEILTFWAPGNSRAAKSKKANPTKRHSKEKS